jgi:phage terminase large subunit-like protein
MHTDTVRLHSDRVLWQEHKPLDEVMELKETTIPYIWETTYQGNPTSPQGRIFKREWFSARFSDAGKPIARAISLDTSLSDTETSAMSAAIVGELMADYSLRIIYCWAEHVQFPQLVEQTNTLAYRFNQDKLLRWIIIEKKVSGFSLIQVLKQSTEAWIKDTVKSYTPKISKEQRYNQAAVWCNNTMVQLPIVSNDRPWLFDFEDDLFSAPDIPFKDRIDAFAQMVLYLSHFLSEGYKARTGRH